MSYTPSTDFLALLRSTSGGVRTERMPGLDYVVSSLARAGLITLFVGQTAPTVNQATTVWFQPAVPSWTAEGAVFLFNTTAGAYQTATPALWTALIAAVAIPQPATSIPIVDATPGVIGVSTLYARQDHVHPTDTTRAPLASPAFTGTPTAPTPTFGDNTNDIATTAFVQQSVLALPAGSVTQSELAAGAAPLPAIFAQVADNLHPQNDAANPTRDINVSPGRVRDDADVTNLQLAAAMGKRLDAVWAAGGVVGASQGACDTGTKGVSQTWHLYLIGRLSVPVTNVARAANVATITVPGHGMGVGGTLRVIGSGFAGFDGLQVISAITSTTISYASTGANLSTTAAAAAAICDGFDVLASQSYPSPAMPSGWAAKQCLGSVLTDTSSNILAFSMYGNEFWLTTPSGNSTVNAPSSNLVTLTTPLGVKVKSFTTLGVSTGTSVGQSAFMYVSSPDATAQNATQSNSQVFAATQLSGSAQSGSGTAAVWTDTSARVRADIRGAGTGTVAVTGWHDPRRRMF